MKTNLLLLLLCATQVHGDSVASDRVSPTQAERAAAENLVPKGVTIQVDVNFSISHVQRATLAIVCVPDDSVSLAVVRLVHRINADCNVIVRCHFQSNESHLMKAGASHVMSEESQTGEALIRLLEERDGETSPPGTG